VEALRVIDHRNQLLPAKTIELRGRDEIESYLRAVASVNFDFQVPYDTFPTPQVSVALLDADGRVLVATWIGQSWFGGSELRRMPRARKRLRRLTVDERARLPEALGLEP